MGNNGGIIMWIFGKCSKDELELLKEWGWEIDRLLTREDINKFCDPSYKMGTDPDLNEPDDEVCPLIWVDKDLFDDLLKAHNEELAGLRMREKDELDNRRRQFADDALGTYDFHDCEQPIGDHQEINDTGNWESDGPDRLICPVYYGDKSEEDPEEEGSYKGSFIVEFKPGTCEIIECHESMR